MIALPRLADPGHIRSIYITNQWCPVKTKPMNWKPSSGAVSDAMKGGVDLNVERQFGQASGFSPGDGCHEHRDYRSVPVGLSMGAVGRVHATAGAGARTGVPLDSEQVVVRDPAGGMPANGLEGGNDGQILAVQSARPYRSTIDEDGGMLRRAMAIIAPGMFLSQPPRVRTPSMLCQRQTVSIESAITWRD